MMTLDDDAAVELLMALDPTPSSGGKGVSRQGSGYIQCEDIQLCTSWMNISNDPIVGNEQPSKTYWNRIADDFHQNRDFDSNRSTNSNEHRMGIILKDCMLFQACYEQIERRNPSGVPYQEHILDLSQARYARASNGKNFQLVHCWLKVRYCEKFASLLLNTRPPKSTDAAPEGEEQQEASQCPPSKKARPPGDDEYKDMMQNLMVMKSEEHKMKKERWDKDMALEQRRLQMEERRLQWEQEQKIMFCDMTTMDAHQRAYVLAKRAQIAKETSVAVVDSASGSVGDSGESGKYPYGGEKGQGAHGFY
ncbi:hypothetical protein PVAP13_1KG438525 [Panicum virgatum]|uniref:No apical meristem-associated C-terminal domain-containing protein n=1 Tax=Panicum virgatum TaxID=38727 RepID=A0A8T0XQM6_PANVG|nr:hypothetical protein PVAP13_1KG438525 [Panicum virgatum]